MCVRLSVLTSKVFHLPPEGEIPLSYFLLGFLTQLCLRGDLKEQGESCSVSMLSPCLFHWCCQQDPNYSSTNCSGGLCDVDSDSFVTVQSRASRSHHIAMIFAKSETELDSYQQFWSERLLSVLCFQFLKFSTLYSWLPLLFSLQ